MKLNTSNQGLVISTGAAALLYLVIALVSGTSVGGAIFGAIIVAVIAAVISLVFRSVANKNLKR